MSLHRMKFFDPSKPKASFKYGLALGALGLASGAGTGYAIADKDDKKETARVGALAGGPAGIYAGAELFRNQGYLKKNMAEKKAAGNDLKAQKALVQKLLGQGKVKSLQIFDEVTKGPLPTPKGFFDTYKKGRRNALKRDLKYILPTLAFGPAVAGLYALSKNKQEKRDAVISASESLRSLGTAVLPNMPSSEFEVKIKTKKE